MNRFLVGVSLAAVCMPSAAWAQSTGTEEFEEGAAEEEVVVTGSRRNDGAEGILIPDVPKARQTLTEEVIQRQQPGQSILNTVNLVPGVNYTNADAYGSAGGNLRIRGFDGNRISLTQDGVPLNDTGNYAIFGNQQLDPEIIEDVSVNQGSTDVDSPTASAAGGTVNYRTRIPGNEIGGMLQPSIGEFDYKRVFGMFDTGEFTSFGTKAFVAASTTTYDKFKDPRPFGIGGGVTAPASTVPNNGNNYVGGIDKEQYNARIYQPIGGNGDFVSVTGHWNSNRNNFYLNPSVNNFRTLFGAAGFPTATGGSSADPVLLEFRGIQRRELLNLENDPNCLRVNPGPGRQVDANCSNFFGVRINPSDTGNVRLQSRFTLAENLILTINPSYQYTLANGGGYTSLAENAAILRGSRGQAVGGVDLNGDGDFLDTVGVYTPNNTNTNRIGVTASLIYEITDNHRVRVAYTYDRGRHRQTGEYGFLDRSGQPISPFGGRNSDRAAVLDADGNQVQQRDRLSIALLNQVAGEYRGEFFDNALVVQAGLRVPFFERELNQFCFTQASNGFATCTGQVVGTTPIPAAQGVFLVPDNATGPFAGNAVFAPFEANYKFDAVLPNVGLSYKFTDALSVFGSYAKGFSAPRTDNLYRARLVQIDPEKTDAFDLGLRYQTGQIQGQIVGWAINYDNRIVTSFNQELGISLDRNVGKVESKGVDFGVGYEPSNNYLFYVFGSYTDAEYQENTEIGRNANGTALLAPTAGKKVAETPEWQVGARVQAAFGPFTVGVQGKFVDERFATDVNDLVTPSYTTVDLDARLSLAPIGLDESFLQLNVINLFDKFYFGNISTQINAFNVPGQAAGVTNPNPNFSIGAPRTISATLRLGF